MRSSQKCLYLDQAGTLERIFFFILRSLSIFPAAKAMAKSSSIGIFKVKDYISQHSLSQHFKLLIYRYKPIIQLTVCTPLKG